MRNLYILLTATIIIIILLIAFAFLFLEKEKHQRLFYVIETAGKKTGYVEVDRYRTEDKIIYKSISFRPEELDEKITHEKFVFDRKYFNLERFTRECKNFGTTTKALYIKNNGNQIFGFLAKYGSKFSTVSNIDYAKDISIFNPESIVTHVPLVDKYDLSRGGAQSFKVLYYFLNLLPPARCKIVLTSIRDDYLKVGRKKIKTECIVVKAKALPETRIWISKKDKSIVRLEDPSRELVIKRVVLPQKIVVQDYVPTNESYDLDDIIFSSGDIALAGTLAIPRKDGKLPCVLLVTGEGPYNRDNAGLYTDISRELAQSGYVVLRFDRRGMGKSQGDNMAASLTDEIKDIENALRFLLNHEKVDSAKAFIVAHADACSYLPQLDFSTFPVRGLVMLGAMKPEFLLDFKCEHVRSKVKLLTAIDRKYPETLDSLKTQTLDLVKDTKKEYATVERRRVFLKRMRQLFEFKPLEGFKKLDMPLMIIYGKKDIFGSPDYIEDIENALRQVRFQELSVICFRGLGHFFGEIIRKENRVKKYETSKEVLETIRDWINKEVAENSPTIGGEGLTNT